MAQAPSPIIRMRFLATTLLTALLFAASAAPGRAFSDAELVDGFMRTVFGSEYPAVGWQAGMVKKFTKPVRFYIDDRTSDSRGREVEAFVRTLPRLIPGVNVFVVSNPGAANYRIFVLERTDYASVVSREVYGRTRSTYAPGKCLVRVVATRSGISRSDAAIVADEGDFLFRRCLVEEVLQGLGPVNDDIALPESVFNDRSPHSSFTSFDRHILNMLYHPLIRPGMNQDEARRVLPAVVADVRARLR